MSPYFTARRRFDNASEGWKKFLEFAKIPGLVEVVGLDVSLSPPVLEDFVEEDFQSLSEDEQSGAFTDLEHLLKRIEGVEQRNVLAVIADPAEHIEQLMEPGFNFAGYELIEDDTGISALTNCGGFPAAFSNEELNEFGLVTDLARAREIQRALSEKYPNEPHAQTMVYAIWRLNEYARVPVAQR